MIDEYRYLVAPTIRRRFEMRDGKAMIGNVFGASGKWLLVRRSFRGVPESKDVYVNMDHVLYYHEEAL